MNYKAIEAALVAMDCDNANVLMAIHGPNILRIVRAMGWMEEQGPTVRDSRGVAAVEVYRDGCKETHFGPTIIDAIEAAMTATAVDQQPKGANDEA